MKLPLILFFALLVGIGVYFWCKLIPAMKLHAEYKRDLARMKAGDAVFVELTEREVTTLHKLGIKIPRPRMFIHPHRLYVIVSREELRTLYEEVLLHSRKLIGDAARSKQVSLKGTTFYLGSLSARLASLVLREGDYKTQHFTIDKPAAGAR